MNRHTISRIIRRMDADMTRRFRKMEVKHDFEKSIRKLRTLKNALLGVEKDIAMLNAGPQRELLEMRMDLKRVYESDIEGCRAQLVNFYKSAIMEDLDIDGSRLLSIYRFFYRNRAQLHRQLALINVPRGSYAVWGIIILTAIMFLYAAV